MVSGFSVSYYSGLRALGFRARVEGFVVQIRVPDEEFRGWLLDSAT